MDAGWARWILEQFEFPFDARVRAGARRRQSEREVRHADLRRRRHSRAPAAAAAAAVAAAGAAAARRRTAAPNVPAEYRSSDRQRSTRRPHAAAAQGVRRERRHGRRDRRRRRPTSRGILALPIENHLVENGSRASADEVLRAGLGAARARRHDAARSPPACKADTDFFFDNSPVWKLGADAAARGVQPHRVVRLEDAAAQRLGLGPGVSRPRRDRGRRDGRQGPRAALRRRRFCSAAQPHATFKLLFNGIYLQDDSTSSLDRNVGQSSVTLRSPWLALGVGRRSVPRQSASRWIRPRSRRSATRA